MFPKHPLFNTDTNNSGGTGGTSSSDGKGGNPAPQGGTVDSQMIAKLVGDSLPKGINLDTPISFNGKAYTVKELVEAQAKLGELEGKVKGLEALEGTVKRIWGKDASNDEKETQEAMVSVLMRAGHTREEAEKILMEPNPSEPSKGGKGEPKKKEGGNSLQSQVTSEVIKDWVQNDTKAALLSNKDMKAIVEGVTRRDGEEAGAQVLEMAVAELLGAEGRGGPVDAAMFERHQRGQPFARAWIKEEAEKLVPTLAKKFRLFTGDPNALGKTPAMSAGLPFALSPKPVERPKVGPGVDAGTQSQAFREYMDDSLTRMAAGMNGVQL